MEALILLGLALAISVAGGIGAVLRLYLARWSGYLPWGILLSNSLASALAGFLVLTVVDPSVNAILVSGLLGGLSTFSSWAAANGEYQAAGLRLKSLLNWSANLVIPMLAAGLGLAVGGLLIN